MNKKTKKNDNANSLNIYKKLGLICSSLFIGLVYIFGKKYFLNKNLDDPKKITFQDFSVEEQLLYIKELHCKITDCTLDIRDEPVYLPAIMCEILDPNNCHFADQLDYQTIMKINKKLDNFIEKQVNNVGRNSMVDLKGSISSDYIKDPKKFQEFNLFFSQEELKCLKKYYNFKIDNSAKINQKLRSGLKKLKTKTFKNSYEYAAAMHRFIVQLHPYKDGNGRLARKLSEIILGIHLNSNDSCDLAQNSDYCFTIKQDLIEPEKSFLPSFFSCRAEVSKCSDFEKQLQDKRSEQKARSIEYKKFLANKNNLR